LLIGAFGKVIYNIYSEELGKFNSITLEEGDLLIIPKNIEHSAIPLCPRIVISVGIF
jgi:cupin superfamily acireductone dioxygenase involved in methionine salvage